MLLPILPTQINSTINAQKQSDNSERTARGTLKINRISAEKTSDKHRLNVYVEIHYLAITSEG
jgi:hypothetical protein